VFFISTPIRRIRSGCYARAASGHAAAPPRRLILLSQNAAGNHDKNQLFGESHVQQLGG
jgi:hypothetical protein